MLQRANRLPQILIELIDISPQHADFITAIHWIARVLFQPLHGRGHRRHLANRPCLGKAVRVIMEGENYFGRDIATLMYDIVVAKRKSAEQGELEFTDKESDVIRLYHEKIGRANV